MFLGENEKCEGGRGNGAGAVHCLSGEGVLRWAGSSMKIGQGGRYGRAAGGVRGVSGRRTRVRGRAGTRRKRRGGPPS